MTAKERLRERVESLSEEEAARARIVVEETGEDERERLAQVLEEEPEMAPLPEAWKRLPSGAPAPNWVALLHESRRGR